jgi:hypothetical protein
MRESVRASRSFARLDWGRAGVGADFLAMGLIREREKENR